MTIGRDEVNDILAEQGQVEICCHFCDKKYVFTPEDCDALFAAAAAQAEEEDDGEAE